MIGLECFPFVPKPKEGISARFDPDKGPRFMFRHKLASLLQAYIERADHVAKSRESSRPFGQDVR